MMTPMQKFVFVLVFVALAFGFGVYAVVDSGRPTVAQQIAALGPKAEGHDVTLMGAVIPEYNAVKGWSGPVQPVGLPNTSGNCETFVSCITGGF